MSSQIIRPTIEALKAYEPGEQPQGRAYIKLNTNENPYPPSPRVMEAIRGFDAEWLRSVAPMLAVTVGLAIRKVGDLTDSPVVGLERLLESA